MDAEGPILREQIDRRVTQLWGLPRSGKRIRESVDQAISSLPQNVVLKLDGDFFMLDQKQTLRFAIRTRLKARH